MKRDNELDSRTRPLARTTHNAPVAMALFDPQRRFLAASKSWRKITSIWGQDYLGLTIEQIRSSGPSHLAEHHRRAATGEHFVSDEEEYLDTSGVQRWPGLRGGRSWSG